MKPLSLLLLSSGLCLLFGVPAGAQNPPAPVPPAPVADPAATEPTPPQVLQLGERPDGDLVLTDIDGKLQRAKDLMGKVTVVNFYSIQCPVQAAWDQRLAAIQRDFAPRDVVFLHVDSNVTEIGATPPKADDAQNADAKPYQNIRAHLLKKELPFRVLVDHGNKVADAFGATATPHVFVFGNDGRLVYRGLVDDDQRGNRPDARHDYLRLTLTSLCQGDRVEPFETKAVGCSIKRADDGDGPERRPRGPGRRRTGGQ